MRAERVPELLVAALADEVEVELAERRRERIASRSTMGSRRGSDLEPVAGNVRLRGSTASNTPAGCASSRSTGSPRCGSTRTAVAAGRNTRTAIPPSTL